jgi:hypothetical protein
LAAVFRALLIVWIGVVDLGTFLRLRAARPGWEATRNALRLIPLKMLFPLKMQKIVFPEVQGHFEFLELANNQMQDMEKAWRNKIGNEASHLVILVDDFDLRDAEKIISSCHAFMFLLATKGPRCKAAVNATWREPIPKELRTEDQSGDCSVVNQKKSPTLMNCEAPRARNGRLKYEGFSDWQGGVSELAPV